MRFRRGSIPTVVVVLTVILFILLVPGDWYARHVPFWVRLPVGFILGALWLLLFVGLPLWTRFARSLRRQS
jgi:hypothetical protein